MLTKSAGGGLLEDRIQVSGGVPDNKSGGVYRGRGLGVHWGTLHRQKYEPLQLSPIAISGRKSSRAWFKFSIFAWHLPANAPPRAFRRSTSTRRLRLCGGVFCWLPKVAKDAFCANRRQCVEDILDRHRGCDYFGEWTGDLCEAWPSVGAGACDLAFQNSGFYRHGVKGYRDSYNNPDLPVHARRHKDMMHFLCPVK